ncbi:MAG TPA: hydroxymethylglutaryl-CoA reductase, degradative [Anaerolineales bacterium]|nr:hydroxymethylglutaryl-CoA reductase, degradative [Anaerolineales bacterium]
MPLSSRLPGFYQKSVVERAALIAAEAGLSLEARAALADGLTLDQADHMIENVIGTFALPLAVAANFTVNGRDVLVPMAIEEPSVVASASYMARLIRANGGFTAGSTEPEMIGQIQLLDVRDPAVAETRILAEKQALLSLVNQVNPSIVARGGGARDIEVRQIADSPIGPFLIVHVIYDTRDAMGANAVNTVVESLAPEIEALTGGRVHLRILSNLTDRRRAWASCRLPAAALAFDSFSGEQVRDGIIAAYAFAAVDPYRAATHNKGILNGIDPVVIATGNDWRAIEAGAHAYAARAGRYTSLSTWTQGVDGALEGRLELPLAVGIVGGATRVHPTAQAALQILNLSSARELAEVLAAVGLAQNLGALRALSTEGIQRGHMSLHARQIAAAAGATSDQIDRIAAQLVAEGQIRVARARELLALPGA